MFQISDISTKTKQFDTENMPRKTFDHFAPVKTRQATAHSNNPKSVLNRTYSLAKRGIEISDHRDECAFRAAKSRALRKLRRSDGWPRLSPAEQQEAEDAVIQDLVNKREVKKRAHEREWHTKDERGEIEEEEEGDEGKEGRDDVKEAGAKEIEVECDDEEWISEEDEEGPAQGDCQNYHQQWIDDIRTRADQWYDKLMELEVKAEINALCVEDTS